MTNPAQKTPREMSIEKGKDIVIGIIVLFILLEILGLILKVIDGRLITVVDVFRITITTICCIYLYEGRKWEKLLLALSMSLGIFVYIYTLYRVIILPSASVSDFIPILLLTILNMTAAYYLIFSSDVDEFLKSRQK